MKELIEEIKACEKGLEGAVIIAVGHFDAMLKIAPDRTYSTEEVWKLLDALFEVHVNDLDEKSKEEKSETAKETDRGSGTDHPQGRSETGEVVCIEGK